MARASLLRRILTILLLLISHIYCIVFRDVPRLIFLRRKKISGQLVVISGGAKGIGREVARILAINHAAIVCILDIDEVEGERTVKQINADGGEAKFLACDAASTEEVEGCAKKIYEIFENVDIVICGAGIARIGELLDLKINDFKECMDVNLFGSINVVKAFLPKMLNRNRGQIVAIASLCSFFGDHFGGPYCTSKFALRGFMETLQMEIFEKGKNGVVTTTVFPYFTSTNLVNSTLVEPYSTFWDVLSVEECAKQIVDAILKERLYSFIPSTLFLLCFWMKSLQTYHFLPIGRQLFDFKIYPKYPTKIVMNGGGVEPPE